MKMLSVVIMIRILLILEIILTALQGLSNISIKKTLMEKIRISNLYMKVKSKTAWHPGSAGLPTATPRLITNSSVILTTINQRREALVSFLKSISLNILVIMVIIMTFQYRSHF